jgi:hypothetical protein
MEFPLPLEGTEEGEYTLPRVGDTGDVWSSIELLIAALKKD